MDQKIKILIVEDNADDAELLQFELRNGGIHFEYELAQNESEFIKSLNNFSPDIILSDFSLPSFSGVNALEVSRKITPLIPFIFVSGTIGEERAVELIKNGATDYAIKDKLFALPQKILRALKEAKDNRDKLIAEAERMKMTADLIQRNKNLEQFAYIVSHNLRSPVAKILGLSGLLDSMNKDNEELRKFIDPLTDSVKKLDEVITDLNYILQVKQSISENKETVRFSEMVSNIKSSIENMVEKENVKIITDFSEADELLTLKSYLHSIFFNLISNSIKYRKPQVQPVIEIKSKKKEDGIELVFKDNGLGIDLKKNAEKIFGLYKRFHNHIEGKGMGLFMVKTQVEAIGGKVDVESKPDEGATFKISIPSK